jgi:hypothetical protein
MDYENRYCAYIDILGFTGLVGEIETNPDKFAEIQRILRKVHEPERIQLSAPSEQRTDFKVQSISDAVALSTRCTQVALLALIASVETLVCSLLREGYFTRGAICKGKLYHDDKMVFGEALIRAHALESKIVRYPRVMVAKAVVDDVEEHNMTSVSARITRGDDGPSFVHVLRRLEEALEELKVNPEEKERLRIYEGMREKLIQNFSKSVDTPRHFEKAQWFADYWNRTVDSIGGHYVMRIDGPGTRNYSPPFVDNRIS